MRPIQLTPRLASVASLVPPGATLVDVGTDHGLLPVYLLQRDLIQRAVATDLRAGPLSKARANAEKYGLSHRISLRLCNGLAAVASGEGDIISIAGMGGETIAAILEAAPWAGRGGQRLILQPMTSLYDLRDYLSREGYIIHMEHLNRDGGRLYVTMEVSAGGGCTYTPGELWAGRQWPGMDSPLRGEFLTDMERRARRALAGLEQSVRPLDEPRRDLLRVIVPQVAALREEWQQWQT